MIDLSITIVTYNNEDEIANLLEDIFRYTKNVDFQVYVVDNASKDATVNRIKDKYPKVEVIESQENLGFGKGHNLVLGKLHSRYHLVLNPDIRFHTNVLRELIDYMDTNPDVVMITPRVLNQDGSEQFLPKRCPSFKYMVCGRLAPFSKAFAAIRAEYTMADIKINEPIEISCCTGCFMLLSTWIFEECKGFDERFFMYLEDAELTQRVAKYGKVMFHPNVSVTHLWERTSAKSIKYLYIHMQSMFKFLSLNKNR